MVLNIHDEKHNGFFETVSANESFEINVKTVFANLGLGYGFNSIRLGYNYYSS